MVSSPVLYTVLDVYSCFFFWGGLVCTKAWGSITSNVTSDEH
jgi:hypothetical protein